jgi:hypothetical protein
MKKANIKIIIRQISAGLMAIVLLFAFLPNIASASAITTRSVKIGNSVGGTASTTYDFTFTAPTATPVKSIKLKACLEANFASCTPVSGFSSASSSLFAQPTNFGTGVWTASTGTPAELRAANDGTNATNPTAGSTVRFQGVHNPTASNTTFFFQITTYSDTAYTNALDTGSVATSTAGLVTINANVDETLTFTLATATVALGAGASMTTSVASTGTSTMTASTNATGGYTITYNGTTLAGPTTLTAMSGASSPGSKQFGLNLVANTGGRGGTNVSGSGTGVPWLTADYGTPDSFKFLSGDTVAHATIPTLANTYTVDYLANIDAATPAGAYTTNINYVATANF